ncbi:hypothetical protein ACHAWF_008928 [Thalassiosira exigua]
MARYALAATALLASSAALASAHEDGPHDGSDAWSYLPVSLPHPMSDTAVSLMDFPADAGADVGAGAESGTNGSTNGDANGASDGGGTTKKRIVLTGGCDSPLGNEYREFGEDEWFECGNVTSKVFAFDPIRHSQFQAWSGDFHELAEMPRTRHRHASAVVGGKLCVFGGRDATDALIPEVDCYDAVANEWTTPTVLPEGRRVSDGAIFATDDGTVYLIGGYEQGYTALTQVTAIDMSDLANPAYSDGPQLLSSRGDIDVAVLDDGAGDAYVSGGFTHEDYWAAPRNTVEKFSRSSGTWADVPALNDERGDKQLVAVGGKIFAIGGESKVDVTGPDQELPELGAMSQVLDSVEVLDPTEDVHGGLAEWRQLGGMPGQLFRFSASEWEVEGEEGYIFVFGGQVGYDSDCKCFRTTDKVLVFDVSHAEAAAGYRPASGDSGAGNLAFDGGAVARGFALIAASLVWLAL